MRAHTVDYLQDSNRRTCRERVSRGFWIHDVPRLLLACRLTGHKPVVNGYDSKHSRSSSARWVACGRCGVRPDWQGNLDPAIWNIGQPYTGTWTDQPKRLVKTEPSNPDAATPQGEPTWTAPGPWPTQMTGTIGGQLVIGNTGLERIGVSLKVGNAGSEHTLASSITLPLIGSLYLHTEAFGRGIQQRLNPVGYDSKVIELGIGTTDHTLRWRLWAPRDSHSASTPRWKDGHISLDLVERAFGPQQFSYVRHGLPVMGLVRMPEGDDHQVRLTLKRQTLARTRRPDHPIEEMWIVYWSTRAGIPFRNHAWKGDSVYGGAVHVSDAAVEQGRWVLEACAALAVRIAEDRTSYRWRPAEPEPADEPKPVDEDPLGLGPEIKYRLCNSGNPRLPECTEVRLDPETGTTVGITSIPARVMVPGAREEWADQLIRYAQDCRADRIELPPQGDVEALLATPLQLAWNRTGATNTLDWRNGHCRLDWPTPTGPSEPPDVRLPRE